LNAEQLGMKFAKMHKRRYKFHADYVKYDRSLIAALLRCERRFYECAGLKNYPQAYQAFMAQMNNVADLRACGRYFARAKWRARRNSGDPNTTLGNSLINMFAWRFVLTEMGFSQAEIELMVNGDDSMVGMDTTCENFITVATGIFREIGLTIEISQSQEGWDLAFNGAYGYPAIDRDGRKVIVAAPQPARFFSKVGWSLFPQPDYLGWNRGIAQAWRPLVAHVPMYSVLIDRVLTLTEGVKPIRVKPTSHYMFQNEMRTPHAFRPDHSRIFECMQAIHDSTPHDFFSSTTAEAYSSYTRLISGVTALPAMVASQWVTSATLI
jgi:hypothetical protein